jgi:hypothetical protein
MAGPVTPEQVAASTHLPDAVFEVFNTLITERWDGACAVLMQEEVVQRIMHALSCARGTIFMKGYLDVEHAYRKAGWDVVYDKPGYNEPGHAFFTFRKRR